MLWTSIIFFAIAALLGLLLLSYVLQNKETPKGISFIHGPLGAIGLVLLIIYATLYSTNVILSIVLFAIAALMGVVLIYRDLTGKSLPKWLAILHGLTAVTGFILVLVFALSNP